MPCKANTDNELHNCDQLGWPEPTAVQRDDDPQSAFSSEGHDATIRLRSSDGERNGHGWR
jgi:hypothetical protein